MSKHQLSILLSLLFFLSLGRLPAQSTDYIDSLQTELTQSQNTNHQSLILNELAWEYKFEQPDSARALLQRSIQICQTNDYPKLLGDAYNYAGTVEDIHGNSDKAIAYFQKALAIRTELADQKGMASILNNLGNLNGNLGNPKAALDNYRQSLLIRTAFKDTARMANLYYNIAINYEAQGNYELAIGSIYDYLKYAEAQNDTFNIAEGYNVIGNIKSEQDRLIEALSFYEKAYTLHQNQNNTWEEATVLNNLGYAKDGLGDAHFEDEDFAKADSLFDKAVSDYQRALALRQSFEEEDILAEVYNNIGVTFKNKASVYEATNQTLLQKNSIDTALLYLNKALIINKLYEDTKGQMEVYNGLGDVYRRKSDWSRAMQYTKQYEAIAKATNDQKFQQNALKDYARLYAKMGNFEKAYDYRKAYDELKYDRLTDKMVQDENVRQALYSDQQKATELQQKKQELALQQTENARRKASQRLLWIGIASAILLALLLFNRNRIKNKANQALIAKNEIIDAEKQRSEDLLLNILPAQTAQELKEKGKATTRKYDEVTVFFSDFVGFTKLSEQLTPEQLVSELDECFRAFDAITTKYQIEKIKTIGDSYMCVSGLPSPHPDHAQRMVHAALEMQDFLQVFAQKQRTKGFPAFHARIGIHTGPVVAGIVGSKKFAYDIWGDTVNIASRMESSGAINRVNISESTYALVKDDFTTESRGLVQAKGKGEIKMWFVGSKS